LKTGQLATVLTIAFCLTPVIGTALGYFFLHEKPTSLQALGIALCISGAAMVTFYRPS
jgi:drug/metabolite transporter (DMT)-like permease